MQHSEMETGKPDTEESRNTKSLDDLTGSDSEPRATHKVNQQFEASQISVLRLFCGEAFDFNSEFGWQVSSVST